jgi:hypothetical protein
MEVKVDQQAGRVCTTMFRSRIFRQLDLQLVQFKVVEVALGDK